MDVNRLMRGDKNRKGAGLSIARCWSSSPLSAFFLLFSASKYCIYFNLPLAGLLTASHVSMEFFV